MHRRPPSYCHHKASGQAVVRIDGKDHYLGKFDSPQSHAEYNRLLAEWYANANARPPSPSGGQTVAEVLLAYLRWAETHYRDADGVVSRELDNVKLALRPVRALYAHTLGRDFGPLALKAVRDQMVASGLARTVINARVNRIRRVFKWAVSSELVPSTVFEALRTVPGLQRGRSRAREAGPVRPVADEHVDAALPFMPTPVRALVQLQRLTGCRAGEAMALRAADLERTGPVWVYRPGTHKNRHRGLDRVIFLGPQAQAVIQPFLEPDPGAYLFSPRAHVEALRARRAGQRKSKRTPSELRKRKPTPKRAPGERYTRRSYRVAVVRACRKAGVPPWSPLQLRHAAATRIRARYGLEAARVILGHSKVETSQLYAERDLSQAQEIMATIG